MDGSTSRSLLLRVRDNDQDAWRRLVNLYSPLVSCWFRKWGAASDDVPDLLQDVFGAVSRHLPSYRSEQPGSTFRGLLRTIARNKLLDIEHRPKIAAERLAIVVSYAGKMLSLNGMIVLLSSLAVVDRCSQACSLLRVLLNENTQDAVLRRTLILDLDHVEAV